MVEISDICFNSLIRREHELHDQYLSDKSPIANSNLKEPIIALLDDFHRYKQTVTYENTNDLQESHFITTLKWKWISILFREFEEVYEEKVTADS